MLRQTLFNSWLLRFGGWVLSAAAFWTVPARAQVSLSPLIVETQAERGQAQSAINISNSTDQPFRVRIYAEPFTYSREDGFQTLTSDPSDLTPYLQFSPRELNVQPGETRKVRLIARFPPSLTTGEYRAVIFAENLQEARDSGGNSVAIITRIGTTVYVRQGDVAPDLSVEGASWNSEQEQIQLLVRNAGQASARLGVNWTLRQGETVVATGTVDPQGIVAESDRYFFLEGSEQSNLA
ncbi:MAG: P pilus assembly protein, chaperone PapD, partial [Cyanobacteriota bacterium]|nr:P pilus assembly protein, chaperone PapD [Cyanobacteriota bacterium]